jgi:hypothetical protein
MEAQLRLPFLLSGVFTSEFDIPPSAPAIQRAYFPKEFPSTSHHYLPVRSIFGSISASARILCARLPDKSHDPAAIFPPAHRTCVDKHLSFFWHASCLI